MSGPTAARVDPARVDPTRSARMRSIVLALVVALLAPLGSAAPTAAADDWPGSYGTLGRRLQTAVDNTLTAGIGIPGISAAIQTPDGTWTGVAGSADLSTGRAVTPGTPFLVASVTKTFVAAVVLQLVEEGRISLEDRLSRWVSGVPNGSRITVRQMLQHTSGIRDITQHARYRELVEGRPDHVWTFSEIVGLIGPSLFAPGTGWKYSNSNYVLLGRIVERVTGMGIAQAIRTRLLDPLDLRQTWFQGEESGGGQVAMGYRRVNGRWKPYGTPSSLRPTTSIATFFWASGTMVSTPADIARWARALYGGTVRTDTGARVLSAASVRLMTAFNDKKYGLGTRRTTLGDRTAWGHGGSLDGFETSMWYLSRLDAAVVVTWNRYLHESDVLANKLAERLVDTIDPDTEPPVVQVPRVAIRSGIATRVGQVPLRITWPAATDIGTVTRYQLERRIGTGEWRSVALSSATARSVDTWVATDRRVRFRLRAVDDEGNTSGWIATETLRTAFLDETDPAVIASGSWKRVRADGALGGRVLRGRVATDQVRLRVADVRAMAAVILRGRSGTRAGVRWDNGSTTILATSGARKPRWVLAARRWESGATHQVRIRVRPATSPCVEIDGFLVLVAVP